MLGLSMMLMVIGSMTCACGAEETLKIGIIPSDDIAALLDAFDPMTQYLEGELGMEIEVFKATDYTAVVEAMRADKIDAAWFGPLSYVLAANRAGAEAIIMGGTAEGEPDTYHSYIIANANSGLEDAEDLVDKAGETTFAFVDPGSTSGNLVPRGALLDMGIDPETDFEETMFAGGHDAVGLAVQSGNVDAGAMYDEGYNRMVESGALDPEKVKVIWISDPIPKSPFAVKANMDPELKDKIQRAFVDMPEKDPEAMQAFEGMWEGSETYVAIDDSMYEPVKLGAIALGYIEA